MPQTTSIRVLAFAFCLWFAGGVWSGECSGQDSGQDRAKEAFARGSYPWYDKANDTIDFSPDISEGGSAGTAARNGIPVRQVAAPRQQTGGISWWWVTFWTVLLGLLVALLIAVVIWLLLKVDPPTGFSGSSYDTDQDGVFGSDRVERLPFDVRAQTGDFRAAAEQAYKSGDFRLAVIYLFSHVLLTLDRHKRVRLRKGKTNRQYLGEMKSSGASSLTSYYERLMVSFESAFFGNYEVSSSQFEESWNALPEFQNRLSQLGEVARD